MNFFELLWHFIYCTSPFRQLNPESVYKERLGSRGPHEYKSRKGERTNTPGPAAGIHGTPCGRERSISSEGCFPGRPFSRVTGTKKKSVQVTSGEEHFNNKDISCTPIRYFNIVFQFCVYEHTVLVPLRLSPRSWRSRHLPLGGAPRGTVFPLLPNG